ncbi:family 43 glycosylhydrolase [Novosphingobium sp. fls2-241-R2A-195]|uniref:family 43 glycosylhydrolase n=1 Tax=Novosphingobium sp. fls2-241-R2A-195 TaxID=3040296 RepID=UPI00254E46DB|nr:family 43 glycosylhydrolase [Novosphingobium sp. fls2-241-R2A-195]
MKFDRREALFTAGRAAALGAAGGAASLTALAGSASAATAAASSPAKPASGGASKYRRGFDDQRIPDQGNGTYLNPLMAGDHPDPTIVRDGKDYYMTFSTFDSYPGLVVWHSADLINWRPLTAALTKNLGSVWAPDISKHGGRFFIYFTVKATPNAQYVVWADKAEGPWSEPVSLGLPDHIDPGHAVGEDGSRWLFLSGGDRIRLAEDGLSTVGAVEHVYDPWHYPEDWDVEGFSPEGPKIVRRGEYFYLVTAVGGTAGPPTGHMVIAARSKSIHGPWENCPHNPIVRTTDLSEAWWSRGHATLFEGPAGDWWSVYHGYEKDFWTLGRQTLLDPVSWTADGWFRMEGGDLSKPIRTPRGGRKAGPHGMPLSDDFSTLEIGRRWNFFKPSPTERDRARVANNTLHLTASGKAPVDSSPLLLIAGDQAYEFQCEIDIDPGVTAGLLLFYDQQLYCGLGFDAAKFVTHQYGMERGRPANYHGRKMLMRVRNDRHIVAFHTSGDGGKTWKRFDRGMEVSGYHHNVRGGFLMLRPGLYSAGQGEARFSNFKFKAL